MSIQISISNAIGSRYRGSVLPPIDPDAQAFITAASITNPTQQSAINQLVVDLKGYGIWTKMKALYPFVGGTAAQHKWNLKDPRDLDAAFRLVFSGGWTHSVNGATPNGTNAFADTKFATTGNITQNSGSMGVYSRTNTATTGAHGIRPSSLVGLFELFERWTDNNFYCYLNDAGGFFGTSILDSRGFNQGSRTASNVIRYNRNTATNTGITNSNGTSTLTAYIGASNANNTATFYNNREIAFYYIGDGLTNTEMQNYYTAVQSFQVTLGRSIGTQTVSDADAQAFVTNAGIVDQVEANAINNLVIGLKADSLWTKMRALYPFVGGTSTTNSYNLKNTAQYQITWAGGVTHANTGVTFNGTNGYGNTNFAPNSVLTANSNHISLYSRTTAARTNGLAMDFGQGADVNVASGIYGCSRRSNNTALYAATNVNTTGSLSAANTNGSGMFVNSITSSTSRKIYRNAVTLGTLTTNISQTLSAAKMYIAAFNNNDSGVLLYSDYQAAFFSIGDGLDDTEAANLNTRVTTFQTALNRNV